MKDKRKKLWFRNTVASLALGAGFFLGGLFLTIWTWGFGGLVGVPMMILGLVLPFWLPTQSSSGKTWYGVRQSEHAVENR